ncbi:hypothetical protein KORDIASMS9_03855 [Kordia sp. SMS9]|uniref:hypothetical protein n=1 Tax=Kordia sp. SMS9 TaxID=2282170 RepID=UPI000E0DFDF8|nr:hypothetical protein [Kordia sp. SMS9]AXG71598.1 hypothetical protein KORDIASMS9_03855 [Kordia sp. SMS9]
MKTVTYIKEILIAALLLVTLTLPSFIQFSHQLEEEHTYSICLEQNDHIHENNVHCDICDYQFSNFYFEFVGHSALTITPIISIATIGSTTPLCYYLPRTNTQLRAPPSLS